MLSSKQPICVERLRVVPTQFSWVDHRLVRDGHLARIDVAAAALYLFLVTVADGRGLSWYGDASTARRLAIDTVRVQQARASLVRAGLVAYSQGVYQVLALESPSVLAVPHPDCVARPPSPSPAPSPLPSPISSKQEVRDRLAALYAALERRP